MIVRAPGKVVLWGEYAVLDGAPAAVMALNRFATVQLAYLERGWRFVSRGFLSPGVHQQSARFSTVPGAQITNVILEHWGYTALPRPFALMSDSSPFYSAAQQKLGLGSSAAICTATYLALAQLLERPPEVAEAIAIHRKLQGGKGSGMDVAASWHGGVVEFQDGQARAMRWPDDLYWRVVWSGASASTTASLGSFESWRKQADTQSLNRLGAASEALCRQPDMPALAHYSECLRAFDDAARLNIFTPSHQRLATIAAAHGLVYKPCGAGGGDIGLACGTDDQALTAFTAAAAAEEFMPLDMEIAPHGVELA